MICRPSGAITNFRPYLSTLIATFKAKSDHEKAFHQLDLLKAKIARLEEDVVEAEANELHTSTLHLIKRRFLLRAQLSAPQPLPDTPMASARRCGWRDGLGYVRAPMQAKLLYLHG